jgi:catechol 2,3-dioxygenase-like lactoylglutathione lyase family enzyme
MPWTIWQESGARRLGQVANPERSVEMSRSLLHKITTVEVPVADLSRALDWYVQKLGLEISWRGEHEATVSLPEGAAHLFLVQTDDLQRLAFHNSRHGYTQSIVDFYTPDLVGLHAHLREQGIEVNDLQPGAKGFGFRDLDGNSLGAHCAT